jgi:glycosyltransferase involved in cell wall biosynthesis
MEIKKNNLDSYDEEQQSFYQNESKRKRILWRTNNFIKKIKKYNIYIFPIVTVIIFWIVYFIVKIIVSKNKTNQIRQNLDIILQNKLDIKNITNETDIINETIPTVSITSSIIYNNITIIESSTLNPVKTENINNTNNIPIIENIPDPRQIAIDNGCEYIKKCQKGILTNDKNNFVLNPNPKISVVIPVYNCVNTLLATIRSIQNQKMLDIEIILVNDVSDNSTVNLMKEIQKEDPRVRIINNENNMLTFYTRIKGCLSAKGKYLTTIDNDDFFLSEDLFDTIYNTAEEGNFDVIGFNSFESRNIEVKNRFKDTFSKEQRKDNMTIYQPELSCFSISNNGTVATNDLFIWGKLIKTSVYKSALEMLGQERYSVRLGWNEDYSQLFLVYNFAQSYKFINIYGLYHVINLSSFGNRMNREDRYFGDIFFAELIFLYGRPNCKRISVQRLSFNINNIIGYISNKIIILNIYFLKIYLRNNKNGTA